MKVRRMATAFVLAVMLAGIGGRVYAATVKPDVPINYCEYAWWVIECWF